MNTLLIFFALPIATIIISIALQKILKCPALVAAIIFAIFLIVTFIVGNLIFLVATIVYTIIAFITAAIVWLICRFLNRNRRRNCGCDCDHDRDDCNCNCNRRCEYRCGCNCNNSTSTANDLLTISSNCENNGYTYSNNGVTARINVIPNNNTNGRNGCICGSYRRR